MCIKEWKSFLTLVSIVGLTITLSIARGESKDMNQEDCNFQQPNSSVQPKVSEQTEREILDYWTPERMQNAKPLTPTIPDHPSLVPQIDIEPSSPSISAPGSDME